MVFVKTHDISELTSELIGKQVVLGGKLAMLKRSKTALKPLKRRAGAQNVYDGSRSDQILN